jgi:hypothetical protein
MTRGIVNNDHRYVYGTIGPAPAHRILMEDVSDPAGHRVKYRTRRDVLQSNSTMFLPSCTCGDKADRWYKSKPIAKKQWFKLVHIPQVRN